MRRREARLGPGGAGIVAPPTTLYIPLIGASLHRTWAHESDPTSADGYKARPISFRGLPFSVIRMTTGETGWARLPSGRIIFTPYVRLPPALSPANTKIPAPRARATSSSPLYANAALCPPQVHVSDHDLLHQPAEAFQCCLNWTCPCGRRSWRWDALRDGR